jgi:hypothetical protein
MKRALLILLFIPSICFAEWGRREPTPYVSHFGNPELHHHRCRQSDRHGYWGEYRQSRQQTVGIARYGNTVVIYRQQVRERRR